MTSTGPGGDSPLLVDNVDTTCHSPLWLESQETKTKIGGHVPHAAWFKNCGVEVTGSVGQVCNLPGDSMPAGCKPAPRCNFRLNHGPHAAATCSQSACSFSACSNRRSSKTCSTSVKSR